MPSEGFFNIFESKHRDYFFGAASAQMYFSVIEQDDIGVTDGFDFCQGYNTALVAFYEVIRRQNLQFCI